MNNPEYYFEKYLKISPLSHSLWRSVEASEVSKIEFKRPIIDIGCWRGEFTSVFFDEALEAGVDISTRDLKQAQETKKYKLLFQADARRLPLQDNSFNTVLAFSVFEHIPKVDSALVEAIRILKPGGQLVFTVPLKKMENALFYPKIFNSFGLKRVSALYIDAMQHFFRHYNLHNGEDWESFARKAGAEIQQSREIIPGRIVLLWDLFIPFAATTAIHNWKPFPIPGREQLLKKVFISKLQITPDEDCVNLLIVARKPI